MLSIYDNRRKEMSLKKGLDVLNQFTLSNPSWTVDELSNVLNMPASSLYRYIRTLREEGFLQERDGRYSLGFQIIHLSQIARHNFDLLNISKPILDELANSFNETFLLSVISDNHVVCIAKSESHSNSVNVSSEEGAIMPLYAGGSSKALLAFQDDSFIDEFLNTKNLERFTSNTLIDKEEIKTDIESIRKNGFASSDSEQDENVSALGYPIFTNDKKVVASLSIVVPNFRKEKLDNEKLHKQLHESAKNIGRYL